jgi:hypothetical protein
MASSEQEGHHHAADIALVSGDEQPHRRRSCEFPAILKCLASLEKIAPGDGRP